MKARIVFFSMVAPGMLVAAAPARAQCTAPTPVTEATCAAAKSYNAGTGGVSLLVQVDGQVVCEDYRMGSGPTVPHEIWSGTKSFSGILAAAAIEDGRIPSFDTTLADTLTEWAGDPRKSRITLRQLLTLVSGLQADPGYTPTYAQAVAAPALHEPGTVWEYGPVPYQSFGEYLRRRLAPDHADPVAYLQARVLSRIGATYSGWSDGSDGLPLLPHGSQWTPAEWIRYGELVRNGGLWPPSGEQVVAQHLLDEAYHPSSVKSDYGLTWWLAAPGSVKKPCDSVMAFGLGSQKMYVIRSLRLVAVRQTDQPWDGWNFSDDTFLDTLLAPADPQDDCAPAEAAAFTVSRSGDDLRFEWAPVNADARGWTELLDGYELWRALSPDFSDAALHVSTTGPAPSLTVPGEAGGEALVFYRVRARDLCGNVGP